MCHEDSGLSRKSEEGQKAPDGSPSAEEGKREGYVSNAQPTPSKGADCSHLGAAAGPASASHEATGATLAPPPSSPDGPPTSVFRVVALLFGIIAAYSALFRAWDRSDFPETFTSPLYWLGIAISFLLATAGALVVRRRGNWLDSALITGLVLLTISASAEWRVIAQDEAPPEQTFTVAVFMFGGDDQSTRDTAGLFRGAIVQELEHGSLFQSGFRVVGREREIKADTPEEKLAEVRKWSLRKVRGAHLAVWAKVGWDKGANDYSVTGLYAKVYPYGKERNDLLFDSDLLRPSFKARPVGEKRALGPEVIQGAVNRIALCWGLASYRKGDYATALRVLRDLPGYYVSRYYAGLSAYEESTRRGKKLVKEAEAHLEAAVSMYPGEDSVKAAFYYDLGRARLLLSNWSSGNAERAELERALQALASSIKLYEKDNSWKNASSVKVEEAGAFLSLSHLDTGHAKAEDVTRVQKLLGEAFPHLDSRSAAYGLALQLQGDLFINNADEAESDSEADADYRSATAKLEEARRIFEANNQGLRLSTVSLHLGEAYCHWGIVRSNETLFREGMKALNRSAELCQTCRLPHEEMGDEQTAWSKIWRSGSSLATAALERAQAEYRLAERFVSQEEQPDLYASLKRKSAGAYTLSALGEIQTGRWEKAEPLLQAALLQLNAAIAVMKGVQPGAAEAAELYEDRAECYRRLHDYSARPDAGYSDLARQDRDMARELRLGVRW